MKLCVSLFVLGTLLHSASAKIHSLKYFYTASSGIPNFPEYVSVGLVNDVPIAECDSVTKKQHPKQDWMSKVTEDMPQYWEGQTQTCLSHQQTYKVNIETVKQRMNQTGGTHVYQQMYGCEWDDETDRVTGYKQYGFDGEDFIAFDLETKTWIAPRQEAFITKLKWDKDDAKIAQDTYYHSVICPEWLKKYVNYGKDTLMRTELPTISLLQKSSSSRVTCHATGFFPDSAMLFWTKDGDELNEGVDPGEMLPNHDGTFQMSVELDVSSVAPGDWDKYNCVFQLSGVKEDILTQLDKAMIRSNEKKRMLYFKVFIILSLVLLVALLCASVLLTVRNKKCGFKAKSPLYPPAYSEVEKDVKT